MNYQLVTGPAGAYVECRTGDGLLQGEREALDLVAACGEYQVDRLMLHAENLPDDFYHLRTGLAGLILQKFSNYRIRAAAVLTPELVNQGRFQEMVLESNRGQQFRVFYDRKSAEDWLLSLP